MTAQVECRSGASYAERPLAVHWQGQRQPVERVLDRWRSPGIIGFLVRTQQGQVFRLEYREDQDAWQIDLA